MAVRDADGIPLPRNTWDRLAALADRLGVDPPADTSSSRLTRGSPAKEPESEKDPQIKSEGDEIGGCE